MIPFFRKIRKKLADDNKPLKYMKYAIGEIILVVIGILIALQVNNWNNDRINKKRVEAYSKSLIQDISNDIEMISVSQFQAKKSFEKIDSLRNYLSSADPAHLSNTDLYILTHDIMYRPYKWNRSTLDEMKNSEILQYFENDSLKKMLIEYESFSYHLDEDFKGDQSNANRADEIVTEILDLNNPYFSQINVLEIDRFNDPDLNLFETEIYKKSKDNDLNLVRYEEEYLKKFINIFIQIQVSYRVRAFEEMDEIKENANEIIKLLKNEF
jgi:hypothetical protein